MVPSDWFAEGHWLSTHDIGRLLAILLTLTIHVAVLTARGNLDATDPWVPGMFSPFYLAVSAHNLHPWYVCPIAFPDYLCAWIEAHL